MRTLLVSLVLASLPLSPLSSIYSISGAAGIGLSWFGGG
jgi:hypothetical protein